MIIIGLTGGIGSGKTTVASIFKEVFGVPVYIADVEAKNIMNHSKIVRRKVIELLGKQAYSKNSINRTFIASKVFNDETLLNGLNAIIHPKVRKHFIKWVSKQKGNYVIKEAAILFENGSYKDCDKTILITAPLELRIERILQRDQSTKHDIIKRMENQWDDKKKIHLADFVINNIKLSQTKAQVHKLHKLLSATVL